MVHSHAWSWFWLSAGAADWHTSMWPLHGLGFLIVQQLRIVILLIWQLWAPRMNVPRSPGISWKVFDDLASEVPKSQFFLILLVEIGCVKSPRLAQFSREVMRLHLLIGGGAKNLQPSLIYYGDHIKRKSLIENKLEVMFIKDQRAERLKHESLDFGKCLWKRESDKT